MDAASQQRILGYFIEEAKEHLVTLEKGILELSSVVEDEERVNELFRAAHSVKGGAAMLGYGSIQKISHRLEDAFKILQENSVTIDQKLETLFFEGYDALQDLVERLQSPMGLQDDEGQAILKEVEPTFEELLQYLNQSSGKAASDSATPGTAHQVTETLKQMLALFKQDSGERNEIQALCESLARLVPNESNWHTLVETASRAIANPQHSYRLLAPVVITELKQGIDAIESGQEPLTPSPGLKQLAEAKQPQILIPLEPEAAANSLRQAFNKQQLSQLVELMAR